MMHLRVVCARAQSPEVLALLQAQPGVTHITQSKGAALTPAGDAIEAVVAREIAQEVLDALVERDVDQRGEISLQSIDVMLSRTADAASRTVPGAGGDAIVWDELVETTGEDSELTATFLAFLSVACLLAAIGVITHSAVLIVGAMVVSPDFGPLAALGVAAVGRRRDLATKAVIALGVGFPVAIVVTAAFALLARHAGQLSSRPLTNLGDVAFIAQVGPYSLTVALLAGVAGMLALTSQKSGALVGVFISITTVPAAGLVALAVVTGDWHRGGEAMLQLFVNVTGVVVASTVTLWFRRHHIPSKGSAARSLRL